MTLKEITADPAAKFVDVRSPMEFNSGHVGGAVNIPLDDFVFRYKEIDGLGKTPVIFYCRSGNRSSRAVEYLNSIGIKNIYDGGAISDLVTYLN
ncbi:sulfurtransferase [Terrimonas sp.]|uniref:rhodanese-like domain-containing protein n=1 Tax=Terrimonas sp. TaxID=1914338 RepID=UPI000D509E09|nr:rhodanese-like domain-containing protein [Terrimonas sp.]PVD51525.1 sulfurtransferase [Terrimonas sp.]